MCEIIHLRANGLKCEHLDRSAGKRSSSVLTYLKCHHHISADVSDGCNYKRKTNNVVVVCPCAEQGNLSDSNLNDMLATRMSLYR